MKNEQLLQVLGEYIKIHTNFSLDTSLYKEKVEKAQAVARELARKVVSPGRELYPEHHGRYAKFAALTFYKENIQPFFDIEWQGLNPKYPKFRTKTPESCGEDIKGILSVRGKSKYLICRS